MNDAERGYHGEAWREAMIDLLPEIKSIPERTRVLAAITWDDLLECAIEKKIRILRESLPQDVLNAAGSTDGELFLELITEDALHAFAEDQANLGLVKRTVCKHGTIVYGDSLGCVYCGRG